MISLTTISPRPRVRERQARTAFSILALLCAGASTQAQAQFMDMLKNAVGNAATSAAANAASQATTAAVNGAISGAKNAAAPDRNPPARDGTQPQAGQGAAVPALSVATAAGPMEACPASEGPALPPLGPRPAAYQPEVLWPDAPRCIAHDFAHYKFEAARAQVLAFDKAGSPPCPECGGSGRAHDYHARLLITKDGRFSRDFDEPILKLRPGERMEWQGKRYSGTIVLVGEQPIGDFPCRQYKWTLVNKDKEVVAERPGLYCKFRFRDQEVKWRQVV